METRLSEERTIYPSDDFVRKARLHSADEYQARYRRSIEEPEAFWREVAQDLFWFHNPEKILSWQAPHAQWFSDGKTNIAYNCIDRHLASDRSKTAIIWEGENGDVRQISYGELHDEVARLANALLHLGVESGDRVGIYMGMVPEAAIAMLACARIGAIHSVIFGGFAAEAIRDRMNDAQAKVVITQDAASRRGQRIALKENVDRALPHCPSIENVIVFKQTDDNVPMTNGRDHDWASLTKTMPTTHDAAHLPAEHPLFILYTSGTTGKPKGVVHTTGGYMVGTYFTMQQVFDLKEDDRYWCTADVGWITGHSYLVYGPLLNRATVMMYEGALNFPDPDRIWDLVAKHNISILYTAPTAIRAFIRSGDHHVEKHDLSSLRLLGSVGEPINPEAWMWYHRVVGKERCPIVDTWWQTETGAIMISPLPGVTPMRPGSCTKPFFGISPKIVREDGSPAKPNEGGYLIIDKPWPSMLRGIWGDEARFREQYFSKFPGVYFTGDGARCDSDGNFWVMGRVDDVVNVSGHRLGTAEIESALVAHPAVAEAAVVSRPDEMTGQALVAFVTLKAGTLASDTLRQGLMDQVAHEIGKFARPATIRFADQLPKTRSGKIMRRLLKNLATGKPPEGDVTTLEDMGVLVHLTQDEE